MKLLYPTSMVYPTKQTNRLQTLAMSREFSRILGSDFYLGGSAIRLEDDLNLKIVNMAGSRHSPILAFKYMRFVACQDITHVFCREEKILFFMMLYNKLFFRRKIIWAFEIHSLLDVRKGWYRTLLQKADRIIVVTEYIKKDLIAAGIDRSKILVLSGGVDIASIDVPLSKQDARMQLGVAADDFVILYTGHLYAWKGVDTLAEAAKRCGDHQKVYFVGGTETDVSAFKGKYGHIPSVRITGFVDHAEIPTYLKAADMVVLPNSALTTESQYYTSPLKMFEYMASGRPILASDLPSMRQTLAEETAFWFKPDDADSLSEGIRTISAGRLLAEQKAVAARGAVEQFSWMERAKKAVDFIEGLS